MSLNAELMATLSDLKCVCVFDIHYILPINPPRLHNASCNERFIGFAAN